MQQYHDLLKHVMENGTDRLDRTGVGTRSVFGYQMRFNLAEGFPLLTTKTVKLNSIIHENLWFLAGDTNIQYLVKNNVRIWNEWPFQNYLRENDLEEQFPKYSGEWNEKMQEFVETIKTDDEFAAKWGELGPVYGYQWRHWKTPDGKEIDQIANVIDQIKNNPNSRRIIVSAWNPSDIEEMAKAGLPPCHSLFQFYVQDGKLSCQLYQRSADIFLGVPFNIASYSLLTMMLAQVCGLELGEFVHTMGDAHIYTNHFEQVELQMSREPRALPQMKLNPEVTNLFNFKFEDFELVNYDPHPPIYGAVAV